MTPTETCRELIRKLEDLGTELLRQPPCTERTAELGSCSQQLRGAKAQQLRGAKGHYERVPYDKLDPMEMCKPCGALWHVTITAMLLHEHAHWEAIEEMERTLRPRQEDL